jgi:predicted extracellular nuclease
MSVRLDQTLVATGHRNLARFGEVELAAGERLWQATHREAPGTPALTLQARSARYRILLDDGSDARDPEPIPYLDRPQGGTLRLGDTLTHLNGVLDFAFGRFRIHPTEAVGFEEGEPRPLSPPEVDGTLRFVAWNLGNHFNGDGRGGGFPTRGPRSPVELERQRAKLVATLVGLDPDVAALSELENDGGGPESTLGQLAHALNRQTLGAPYAVIDPGKPRLGDHAISVGMLYRPGVAAPIGPPAILDARAHPDFDDFRNRPSLAQTFEARATGERFTVVANHFKSKGSDCDAAGDPDLGDGQGECNATRRRAARALLDWLSGDPTQAGNAPVLVSGDLNAYPQEDPVRAIESGGYVDLVAWFAGSNAHTFIFDGQAGRLDHALGRTDLLPMVGRAGVWHTNADEPRILDHRSSNPPERYAPDAFRASDHDPVLVGLFPDADADGVTDARDACPHSVLAATVIFGDCDSGAPERLDEAGCGLADRLLAVRRASPRRGRWVREAHRWLAERIEEGAVARRHRGAILACSVRSG